MTMEQHQHSKPQHYLHSKYCWVCWFGFFFPEEFYSKAFVCYCAQECGWYFLALFLVNCFAHNKQSSESNGTTIVCISHAVGRDFFHFVHYWLCCEIAQQSPLSGSQLSCLCVVTLLSTASSAGVPPQSTQPQKWGKYWCYSALGVLQLKM